MLPLGHLLQSRRRAGNPVHVAADAPPETYVEASRILLRDPNCDGLLLLTAVEGMSHAEKAAELLVDIENPSRKPILACVMGVADGSESQQVPSRACIPVIQQSTACGPRFRIYVAVRVQPAGNL